MLTPTPGLNQQQENALQEVAKVIDEAVTSGRIAPTVRTIFTQLITQTRALAAGPASAMVTATNAPLTALGAMRDIQARVGKI